ncbi:MAG TPA: carbon-nitrogen hydrolase family protein [Polyangiaceae bacterium]|nr:carbon-nitrogen hydrolase family protein [Polyangiaceae bacterium]
MSEMLPASPLCVAAVQAEPVPGDVAANAAAAARLLARAAGEGARLVVFPELFLPAYDPDALRADPAGAFLRVGEAERVGDRRLAPLGAAARRHRVVALVGAALLRPGGRRTLSSIVVDAEGEAVAAYDKQHLWGPDEAELFAPGEAGVTLRLGDWRLGLGVCYDGCFPEHGRAAALDGAHAYLCPGAFLQGSQHRRDLYYAARALDNTMYVVFANSVGGRGRLRFNGGAAIYEPEGRAIARGGDEGEAVLVAELDPREIGRVRERHAMLRDRRGDLGGRRSIVVAGG